MGPSVEEFEQKFAHMAGVKHAIAVNSGTAALGIVTLCLGVRDREVIVPTETFVASANSVILAGGRPVFAEIHRDTLCLDLADVERRIGPKTAAVMAVHMAGLIQSDINALEEMCRKKNIALIEDAAHAIGASYNGRKAGGLGKAGCFSFYPTKVITTGEGGMITTDDSNISDIARSYRNHGAAPDNSMYERVSTNWRMTEISAVIGLSQLRHLDEFITKRNVIADSPTVHFLRFAASGSSLKIPEESIVIGITSFCWTEKLIEQSWQMCFGENLEFQLHGHTTLHATYSLFFEISWARSRGIAAKRGHFTSSHRFTDACCPHE